MAISNAQRMCIPLAGITIPQSDMAVPYPPIPEPSAVTFPATSPLQRGRRLLPTLLGVGALMIALWAFVRTW